MSKTIEKIEHEGYRLKLIHFRDTYYMEAENLNGSGKRRMRKRWSLKTDDLKGAKDEYYRLKLDLKKTGRLNVVFESGVTGFIDTFLEWSRVNSKAKKTKEIHASSMRFFRDFVTANKIEKLTPQVYEAYKKYLFELGNGPRTVDIKLTAIGKMITVAEELDLVPKGILPRPKLIRERRSKLPKFWTETEVQAILREAKRSSYLGDMIAFGLNVGLRRIELVSLRWADIDLNGGFLNVQGYDMTWGGEHFSFEPKDHEARRIKLNQKALELLVRLRDREAVTPWVFPNKYGLPRLNMSVLNRDLGAVVKRAGARDKGLWHTIRRTFAVSLLMAGADLESIRRLLGHSEIGTTQRYLNVTDRHLDNTVDLIGFEADANRGKVLSLKKVTPCVK